MNNKSFKEDIFNNFAKLNRGFDLPNRLIQEGSYPVVASTSIKAWHKEFKVKAPGVVTGRSGSLGTVQYIQFDYWPLNTSLYVKDFKGNYPKYVYYFLQTMHLENFNSGAGVPTLNQNHLHKLSIKVPPIEIQKKIAAVLSAYDDLIDNNKHYISLLENMAEGIYREWFVRFRFPGYQQAKFEKGFPSSWKEKKFGEFCTLKRGYDLPNSKIEDGKYPVIASTSIKAYHNAFKAEPPVITTGRSGSLGTVLFTNKQSWPLNTTLYVKDLKGNSPYYVYYTLKNMGLENFNSGAGVPTLNRNHINCIKIRIPDRDIQKEFQAKLTPIFRSTEFLKASSVNLNETKNLLLGRLISGKLSVEDLDIQFPPSML
ncbi:restriction endonuclease subunit S [Myxosarcina sp. GI1]|uniref:restriction endonuclease subunit S n=1 Tax=Myxosarcina sp. GI1 TaxID=1541065 RepID=UPI00055FA54B|nr:restriction endonuclease subunit S [Myxosarcina sp. GI1]